MIYFVTPVGRSGATVYNDGLRVQSCNCLSEGVVINKTVYGTNQGVVLYDSLLPTDANVHIACYTAKCE